MNYIVHAGGSLRIPTEIFVAWGQPKALEAIETQGCVVVNVSWGRTPRSIVGDVVRLRRPFPRLPLSHVDPHNGVAVFSDPDGLIPAGNYLPGNYHPTYQLFEVGLGDPTANVLNKAEGNSETWAQIEEYHEHLPLVNQDPEAHAVSQLLAQTIQDRLGMPGSILELGCGAGRNLYHLSSLFPDARIEGVDINAHAAASAELPANVSLRHGNVLELDWDTLGEFDVILTAGFLMHINHDDVRPLMRRINEHARFQLHWELHGPMHPWDYHRYPRSYRQLMSDLDLGFEDYLIFAGHPVYSAGLSASFAHAMLVGRVDTP